ncbi:MAG: GNAT family N-acetyltransferase [Ruminococcaceae bacterium]|nr:GNAT family N-acetyltransferase [Oscillospiraceae bacterium]
MYQVRKAVEADYPRILEIYAHAREFMVKTGNPNQWGTNYPPVEMLQEDIRVGNLFVVEREGLHGVFAYFSEPDPTYGYIEGGAWLNESPYGTIHRVAGDGSGGVFSAVLKFAQDCNPHVRIDTHHDNVVMQHVLEKHGFQRCGIIYLEDGDPRIAYEKV